MMTLIAAKLLSDCKPGESGKIRSMEMDTASRQRLLEMGLLVGSRIDVIRLAPLGDPMEIKVRGYLLSLRKSEAGMIHIETV